MAMPMCSMMPALERHRAFAVASRRHDRCGPQAAAAKGHARFKDVRSGGKVVRAGPILSPDEQGRVHHLGFFPALADQLTARMRATAP